MLEDFRLKVFVTVASTGNFTKAAKALGISQPAVSQNISELEKTMGTTLLKRSPAKVSLTPQGTVFLPFAENILKGYDAIGSIFGIQDSAISIYADKPAKDYVLPEILKTLVSANKDLAIRYTDNKESADICVTSTLYRKSGTMTFIFNVTPEEHPLASAIRSLIDNGCH